MDMNAVFGKLAQSLTTVGAPILRDVVVNAIGGEGTIRGKIAGGVIDALANQLGVNTSGLPPERVPDAIAAQIDKDPIAAGPIVQQVQREYVSVTDVGSGSLDRYITLLQGDAQQEGILAKLWRPLFALVFTGCYACVIITICWLVWTRQLGTLTNLTDVTGFLTFAFIAGCAVLGIQVWKRTEEKTKDVN